MELDQGTRVKNCESTVYFSRLPMKSTFIKNVHPQHLWYELWRRSSSQWTEHCSVEDASGSQRGESTIWTRKLSRKTSSQRTGLQETSVQHGGIVARVKQCRSSFWWSNCSRGFIVSNGDGLGTDVRWQALPAAMWAGRELRWIHDSRWGQGYLSNILSVPPGGLAVIYAL